MRLCSASPHCTNPALTMGPNGTNLRYCAAHQAVDPDVAPKPTLTEGTWDYLWPLVHLKVRGQYRTARWVFAELENSLRPGYAAANVFAVLQHAATLGLVSRNSMNGEYVFMLTAKGWGKNAQVHPFTAQQAGEPPVPQTPPQSLSTPTPTPTLSDVMAKLDKIEKMLEGPPIAKAPEPGSPEALAMREAIAALQVGNIRSPILSYEEFAESRKPFLREPDDPDRVQVPLDIDADLLELLRQHVARHPNGPCVNAILNQLIEDFFK